MKHSSAVWHVLVVVLALLAAAGCAKTKGLPVEDASSQDPIGGYYVSADAPDAVLSDVLLRIKGRWVREIPDPREPNPPTLRLRASRADTLSGRFLVAGAFEDAGVAVTITQSGKEFTMRLIDDEIRPHGYIPLERVFKGTFDEKERELSFKSEGGSGEWVKFKYIAGADNADYKMKYDAQLYRCAGMSIAPPAPGGSLPATPEPTPTPTPTLGAPARLTLANTPKSKVVSCGMHTSVDEDWARVSGLY